VRLLHVVAFIPWLIQTKVISLKTQQHDPNQGNFFEEQQHAVNAR